MKDVVLKDLPAATRVSEVFRMIAHHPFEMLVKRWNWKSALLSAFLRSMIYLTTYLVKKDGLKAALGAMAVEFGLRIFTAGTSGTLVQAFRKANPVWVSMLICSVALPIFSHAVEFIVHFLHEYTVSQIYNAPMNQSRKSGFIVSVIFSVVSVVFNLFAVRRGVLVVGGDEHQSFWKDMKQMPKVIWQFLTFPIVFIWRKLSKPAAIEITETPKTAEK